MLSTKNSQNVSNDLDFLENAILWTAGTTILCIQPVDYIS